MKIYRGYHNFVENVIYPIVFLTILNQYSILILTWISGDPRFVGTSLSLFIFGKILIHKPILLRLFLYIYFLLGIFYEIYGIIFLGFLIETIVLIIKIAILKAATIKINFHSDEFFNVNFPLREGRREIEHLFKSLKDLIFVDREDSSDFILPPHLFSLQANGHLLWIRGISLLDHEIKETCPICREDRVHSELECGHQYCLDCIVKWLGVGKRCPICAREILLRSFCFNIYH